MTMHQDDHDQDYRQRVAQRVRAQYFNHGDLSEECERCGSLAIGDGHPEPTLCEECCADFAYGVIHPTDTGAGIECLDCAAAAGADWQHCEPVDPRGYPEGYTCGRCGQPQNCRPEPAPDSLSVTLSRAEWSSILDALALAEEEQREAARQEEKYDEAELADGLRDDAARLRQIAQRMHYQIAQAHGPEPLALAIHALDTLAAAAASRENTAGDACDILDARARLREAIDLARSALDQIRKPHP